MKWDREKIMSVLPHRDPFLFLDEVTQIEGSRKVVAVKRVRREENFFQGHFPDNPVMPGVLIAEAMAQSAIVLYAAAKPEIAETHPDYYLGKVTSEFLAPVFPGDELVIETTCVKIVDNAGVTDSLARVGDKVVAKAKLVFGVKKR
jgi:3-hydroxyacyl-[acyl-carrier-protein] dehydratase